LTGEGPQLTIPGPRADAFLQGLARRVLAIFFRRVEVTGAEGVPTEAPLVVVANHVNGLIDPALLVGMLPRMPRFLGKSTLWEYRGLLPFLRLAGAIPVYRRHDPGVDPAKNVETFALSWELLARGGVLALFPEGISHSEPELQPLKTGAARIALEAEERHGPLGVRILPVGLVYDAKHKFRSRVLVQVGDPLDPAPELERHRSAAQGDAGETQRRDAVKDLTQRIDEALSEVTLNYESWEEARQIALAAELYQNREKELPSLGDLDDTFGRRRAFIEGYQELKESHPERTAAVARSVAQYDAMLSAFRLRDRQVAARYPVTGVLRFLGRTLFTLLVLLPVALVGTALNYLPYRVLGWIAGRFRDLPDQQATFKVFPGLVIYPVTWLLEGAVAGWLTHRALGAGAAWLVGTATVLLGFVTGWIALRFHDTRRRFFHEVRAFLVLALRRRVTTVLRQRREKVLEEISGLVALYQAERPTRSSP